MNLNAAVLLVPRLDRAGQRLTGEEFANIAGRAGRAFVDIEGLVLYVLHEPTQRWRFRYWRTLVRAAKARSLVSGLMIVARDILIRLARGGILHREDAFEYLSNNRAVWIDEKHGDDEEPFEHMLEKLDSAVLGLLEALDADSDDLPGLIDQMLEGSLWARQVVRLGEVNQRTQLALFNARARLIWHETTSTQRRAHFAMGVGLDSGLLIDGIADDLSDFCDTADQAAISGDLEVMTEALSSLAECLLTVRPFAPDGLLPNNYRALLARWLAATPVPDIGRDSMETIEELFVYRLVWAIEAVRVRRIALGWEPKIPSGSAAACIETGVPRLTMAMLVRAGLPSREAARAAVEDLQPTYVDNSGLVEWLRGAAVEIRASGGDWPTARTTRLWRDFRERMLRGSSRRWTREMVRRRIESDSLVTRPLPRQLYRVEVEDDQSVRICAADFKPVGTLTRGMRDRAPRVMFAWFDGTGSTEAIVERLGRGRAEWVRRQTNPGALATES